MQSHGRLAIDEVRHKELYNEIEECFNRLLICLGADMNDLNFSETPHRVARAWLNEFTLKPFTWSSFDEEPYGGTITLVKHEVWTRCPHHLERVRMHVSIGYLPGGHRILGLSKLARAADYFATGCILQESYTRLLAEGINENLKPKGVAVHTVAEHNCMQARGVETRGPILMTYLMGLYETDHKLRDEFHWSVK